MSEHVAIPEVELRIPEAAYDAGETAVQRYRCMAGGDALDVASDAINAAASLIVAAEYRRMIHRLEALQRRMGWPRKLHDEDYRYLRVRGLGEGIQLLRDRVHALDPDGTTA